KPCPTMRRCLGKVKVYDTVVLSASLQTKIRCRADHGYRCAATRRPLTRLAQARHPLPINARGLYARIRAGCPRPTAPPHAGGAYDGAGVPQGLCAVVAANFIRPGAPTPGRCPRSRAPAVWLTIISRP